MADEALAAADAMSGFEEKPLAGVPIAIKDDMPVAGQSMTRGSRSYGPPGGGRRRGRPAAARGRGDPDRDHQRPRADDLPVDRDRRERGHAQPLGSDADAGRLVRRVGGGGGVGDGSVRDRVGRRRLAPDPGRVLRAGRDEAEPRARLDAAGARGVARAERVRRARPDRRRQRAAARRDPRVAARGTPTPRRRSPGATSTPRRRRRADCGSASRASCRPASSRGCPATSAARGRGPARSSPSSGTR